MPVETKSFTISTQGNCDTLDITPHVSRELGRADISSGTATVFVAGSTCAVTTIEYESGVLSDLKDAFERMAPEAMHYAHNARWGDGKRPLPRKGVCARPLAYGSVLRWQSPSRNLAADSAR